MIIEQLFNLFYFVADWFLSLLPNISLGINIASYVQPVADIFGYMNTFASLPLILTCVTAVLIVDNWTLLVRLVTKIWELLPFS